jgi:5'-deoxynucleotidase
MESHFFAYLYRLRYINRWSLMRNTHQESVAVHSYYVAAIAHLLCTIANEVYGKQVPTEQVVSIALFHDATEVFVGDVAAPVKNSNPEMRRNFRDIERAAEQDLLRMLPPELRNIYEPLIQSHGSELYSWVKAADLLDAYLKSVSELTDGGVQRVADLPGHRHADVRPARAGRREPDRHEGEDPQRDRARDEGRQAAHELRRFADGRQFGRQPRARDAGHPFRAMGTGRDRSPAHPEGRRLREQEHPVQPALPSWKGWARPAATWTASANAFCTPSIRRKGKGAAPDSSASASAVTGRPATSWRSSSCSAASTT